MSNVKLYVAIIGMCILSGFLGFTIGFPMIPSSLKTTEELEQDLIPFEVCIQQGKECIRNVEFYIEYYNIKWAIEARL